MVLDHLDTTEALVKTSQLAQSGKHDWAIGYDHRDACSVAATVCLGVPYFNWGPGYLRIAQSVINHTFKPQFIWDPPDWANLNSLTSSAVGFNNGPALSSANAGTLSPHGGAGCRQQAARPTEVVDENDDRMAELPGH